jgi:hypothetical protein
MISIPWLAPTITLRRLVSGLPGLCRRCVGFAVAGLTVSFGSDFTVAEFAAMRDLAEHEVAK